MASIYDVAKESGVSTATVSRVFSTPGLLSHKTRRHVLEVADRLNYRPRRSQKVKDQEDGSLRGALEVADVLGFLYFASEFDSSPLNDFYAPVLAGAQAEASRLGMHLVVSMAPRHVCPQEMPKMFREQAVAGMLLVGAALPEVLAAYNGYLPPSVLVDNYDPSGGRDCVFSDGFGGAWEATRFLIGLGHRRIGFVINELTASSFQDRKRGWLCALYEAGIMPDPRWIVSMQIADDPDPFLRPVLGSPDGPTAYLAANDDNALAVMKSCRELGLSVPQDVSLIGFDNIPFSVHTYPPLTTLSVDKQYMGRLAVRRLHARLQENQAGQGVREPPIHLTVPVSLVQRETCCPPKLSF